MLSWFAVLRKEWQLIRDTPWSFAAIVFALCLAFYGTFHFSYKGKLDDAHESTDHWKGEAEYWERIAKRQQPQTAMQTAPAPASQPRSTSSTVQRQHAPAQHTTFSAPNTVGSIVNQGAPNFGTQTVNNVPPSRVLSDSKLTAFTSELEKSSSGVLRVLTATTSDDAFPLSQQICNAGDSAHWGIVCPSTRSSIMGKEAIASGLQCYSENWAAPDAAAFKAAMSKAGLKCEYHANAYDFGPVQIGGTGGVTLLIGTPTQP